MHTQEKQIQERRGGWLIDFGGVVGLLLYLVTLGIDAVVGGVARGLGVLVVVSAGALPVSCFVELSGWWPHAEAAALAGALWPTAYSVFSFVVPRGRGKWIGGRRGRRMTAAESCRFEEGMAVLRGEDPGLAAPAEVCVLDDPVPQGMSRGRVMFLTRGVFECDEVEPVAGHEIGHLETLDGRITEALGRMVLWVDPLGPTKAEVEDSAYVEPRVDPPGGRCWGTVRWWLRLAGGSIAQVMLGPVWAAYWRWREYAADEFAAWLGQEGDLARMLEEREQPFDSSPRRRFLNLDEHPPVALRIERLRGEWEGGWLRQAGGRIWKRGQRRRPERS